MSRNRLVLAPGHALAAGAAVGCLGAILSLSHIALLGTTVGTGEPATVSGSWGPVLFANLAYWLSWGFLAPAAGRVSSRFPLTGSRWRRRLAGHALAGTGIAVLHVLVVTAAVSWIWPRPVPFLERGAGIFFRIFDWELVTYAALVGLWHAADHYATAREREETATRLERELVASQLQVLQRQLQPHFMLNALQRILPVVERDAAGASGMLVRLGELLRATVKSLGAQEVTLGDELAFVQRYLEFQSPAAAARVSLDVPEGLEELLVPNLVVQGLVENALKYGVDPRRPGSGRVDVRALLHGSRLRLEVEDDGPGLRPATDGTGTGLANLEARLAHLYGDAHRLELAAPPAGGLLVRVEVPVRAAAAGARGTTGVAGPRAVAGLLALLALAASPALAGGPATSHPCRTSAAYRLLDFWLGRWDVTEAGKPAGTNVVEAVLDGCAVIESWHDAEGWDGKSLFYYDPRAEVWKQVWVTDAGPMKEKRHVVEGVPAGSVRFQGELPRRAGGVVLDRTTLTPLPGGKVRQLIEQSTDGGKSWGAAFDAIYTRHP